MSEISVLMRMAFRNLFSSFLNIIIGMIILVGTLFFVVGGSLLSGVDSSMSRSIIGSIAGHAQVYSEKSKQDLALFGDFGFPDLAPITDFSKVKAPLMSVDNVKTVIPMGVNGALVSFGNTVDLTLERLRKAVNQKERGQIESLKAHIRQILTVIQGDLKKIAVVASKDAVDDLTLDNLEKAASNEFWSTFDRDPLGHLEFLENKIAPMVPDADMVWVSYVGTDLEQFRESFDRMQIVDGQMVPKGKRGMVLAKYQYERFFKLKTAHRLDKIHESLTEAGKTIANDPDLRQMIKENKTQTREIVLQLDSIETKKAVDRLQKFLGSQETDLTKLLTQLFDADDSNFAARYKFFYDQLAPLLELYRLRPGEMLTIKAFTKSGFMQASNIKVYGTFQFKGLEKSGLAGALSLMDLMSFRDLYGFVTPEKIAETGKLREAVGVQMVERDKVESELFGGSSIVGESKERRIDDKTELGDQKPLRGETLVDRVYSQEEIESGVALNAAIIVKDPSQLSKTMKDIEEVSKSNNLGLKVVSWQKAAGNIGNFVYVAKAVLYFAVFIIFVVALVIINNAVMMATLQRVREIGTMRAIGAQRSFVLWMVLIETLLLGLVFGSIGTLLGSSIVKWMGVKGIPAGNEFLYFFFSGPRLYVPLSAGSLIGAFVIICLVTSISALYPAIIATRVSPIRAMQTED
jgi:ABC-type lipoprotein release transport system permease subunit